MVEVRNSNHNCKAGTREVVPSTSRKESRDGPRPAFCRARAFVDTERSKASGIPGPLVQPGLSAVWPLVWVRSVVSRWLQRYPLRVGSPFGAGVTLKVVTSRGMRCRCIYVLCETKLGRMDAARAGGKFRG